MLHCCFAGALTKANGHLPDPQKFLSDPCPAVSHTHHRKLIATVSLEAEESRSHHKSIDTGEIQVLQAPDSDVSLLISDGSPGIYTMTVHTDFSAFTELIPDKECFVSPVVEINHFPLQTEQIWNNSLGICQLIIPHCSKDKNPEKNIKVRCHKTGQKTQVSEEFRYVRHKIGKQCHGTFTVDKNFVRVYTRTFSKFTCTNCTLFSCQADMLTLLFAELYPSSHQRTAADMELFLLTKLYQIKDLKQVRLSFISVFF